uniref:Uncharacterized protein n=1 Tax=Zea mays TaxID=4577 RepID=C4IZD0_MAIZE|nr:unknown [Zea mays]
MVGTGAPAGASASGLRFCTSIPPGRTSHSSSFTAAEAGAGGGGGGGELSLIASANVPLGLARIIFSWYVHAPRASEAREGGTERIKNQPLLLRALASNSSQERATSGRVSSALLCSARLSPKRSLRAHADGSGRCREQERTRRRRIWGRRFAAAASAGACASSRVSDSRLGKSGSGAGAAGREVGAGLGAELSQPRWGMGKRERELGT